MPDTPKKSTTIDSFQHGADTMRSCIIYATFGAIVGTVGILLLPASVYMGLSLIIVGMYLFLVGGPINYFSRKY